MLPSILVAFVHLLVLSEAAAAAWLPLSKHTPLASSQDILRNPNHIFNAIHSSGRQRGSTLNRNGMSFFLATVPEGVQFYHGTRLDKPVAGMGTLFFEPEDAMVFAGSISGRGRLSEHSLTEATTPQNGNSRRNEGCGPSGRSNKPVGSPSNLLWHGVRHEQIHHENLPANFWHWIQKPLSKRSVIVCHDDEDNDDESDERKAGYLYIYRTVHPQNLLYIDGMSAAETQQGTLDSQDAILLNADIAKFDRRLSEDERSQGLCDLSYTEWQGKVDGFVRMGTGFEIILCNFDKHLETVRITALDKSIRKGGRPSTFRYSNSYRRNEEKEANSFNDIRDGQVTIHCDSFVTAYSHDLDLFHGAQLPRLLHVPKQTLRALHDEVTDLVLQHSNPFSSRPLHPHAAISITRAPPADDNDEVYEKHPDEHRYGINWQSITDLIVDQYAPLLSLLLSPTTTTETTTAAAAAAAAFHAELDALLSPFTDVTRNPAAEIYRCAEQFMPR
ncbi:hypothetical protein LTS18_010896 [Coniosporium uncinatum]|uniref:Uncharacterized protein n=1 Tax=Coniosporium uncinatum TaxID=93489 RepID=A0ACC3D9V0_9PEZI|nr:hypothetical protein LTS18_010896 [Coniosporium uncinatum]